MGYLEKLIIALQTKKQLFMTNRGKIENLAFENGSKNELFENLNYSKTSGNFAGYCIIQMP